MDISYSSGSKLSNSVCLTHRIDGYFFSSFDELSDLPPQQVELDITREEVANSEGWEEGERVGGLDVTVGVGWEIFTLNIHTKPVGQKLRYTYIITIDNNRTE